MFRSEYIFEIIDATIILFGVVTMLNREVNLVLSPYSALYDILVPKDHDLRKLHDLLDFSFVYDELEKNYSQEMGRKSIDPVYMFKLLLLKKIYNNISDRDLVKRAMTDLAIKYFLDIAPEDSIVDASTLTKFRTLRLKDSNLLDLLIEKSVELAIEKDVIKSKTIIMDATHTQSRFGGKRPITRLQEMSKNTRKLVYKFDESMTKQMPEKYQGNDIEGEITYVKRLVNVIRESSVAMVPAVSESVNKLEEFADDAKNMIIASKDEDATVGYKSKDNPFFGYKSHIAMNEDRIITGVVVTSGEAADGKFLPELVRKTRKAGLEVERVLADAAYSSFENYEHTNKEKIELISRFNSAVTGERDRKGFIYNKDADQVICPQGKLSDSKTVTVKENGNITTQFRFGKKKCRDCPLQAECWNLEKSPKKRTKTISFTTHTGQYQEWIDKQSTDDFKEKAKNRYMIEAKNDELKNRHGLKKSKSDGLFGMEIEAATAIFVTNLKRIMKLMDEK
jgi:transposase